MSEAKFQPFADQTTLVVRGYNEEQAKYCGGALWVLHAKSEACSSHLIGGSHHITVQLRCSLPVNCVPNFRAELTCTGRGLDVNELVSIGRDGWVFERRSTWGYHSVDTLSFVIRVLGASENSSNLEANVVLEVENREFPANVSHLSSLSPVFKETLSLEFPEGEPRKVRLDSELPISADVFEQFMAAINGSDSLSDENVDGIRELADRFDVQDLLKRCSDFVCRTEGMPLLKKFQLAENWRDNQLKIRLTALVGTGKRLKDLLQAGMTTTLAADTQDLIFKKAETLF